ncbi:MAG: type I methionyl aminopeptidase [Patescibacteria group bacterium]
MITLKTPEQIATMREGGKILAMILQECKKFVLDTYSKRELKTIEIDHLATKLLEENGATAAFLGYHDFPGHICVSINEEVIHGIPGERVIQEGDLVSLDFGVLYKGLITDAAISFVAGQADPKIEELLQVTEEALMQGIAQIEAGKRIGVIGNAVETHILPHRFGIVRDYVGHGVGLAVHEEPHVPNYGASNSGPVMEEGLVIAIEPMVTLGTHEVFIDSDDDWTVITEDGTIAAHFEHTVAITATGPVILTLL